MKVICKRSVRGPGISLVDGEEYDLTAAQIKAVGSSVEVIEKPKKAAKPIDKGPRKAPAKAKKAAK